MAVPVRGTKASAGGGTAFVANTDILASEVNTDFDNAYSALATLDNDNISASADIALTKLADTSSNSTTHATATTPGDSSSHTLPTTLEGEVQQLRYAVKRAVVGTNAKRLDGTATTDDCFWGDRPARGPNLIRNSTLFVPVSGNTPSGWTAVGTPLLAGATIGVADGAPNFLVTSITASGAANEGLQQTIAGLKASTRYQIGCRVLVGGAGDTFSLTTTGASGATFGDLNLTTTSTTAVTLSGVILTDATPTDIVVQLLAVADTDAVIPTHVWCRECTEDPLPQADLPWVVKEITTSTADHYANGTLTDSGISGAVVYVPGPGYVIEVSGKADVGGTGSNVTGLFVLRENGTIVDSDYVFIGSGAADAATARLFYVNTNPTPGTAYTYTIYGCGEGDTLDRNPTALETETPTTMIRARAYLESGGH